MTFEWTGTYDCAIDGNIALTGELDLSQSREFVLALAFGDSLHHALVTLAQTLGGSFADHRSRFIEQWQQSSKQLSPLNRKGDGRQRSSLPCQSQHHLGA